MRRTVTSLITVVVLLASSVAPAAAVAGPATGSRNTAGRGVASVGSAPASATQPNCSFPVSRTDATGTEVTVGSAPERVVTLGPSAAQTLWEIGGKSQVVGLTRYASYLNGSESRTNVSGAGRTYVDVERVVGAEPDLVLAANIVSNETVRKLRQSGLTVYRFEKATSIDDIYAKTSRIGELTGNCAGAADTVAWMRDRIATVREAVDGTDRPRVLLSQGGGWTAGKETFLGQLVALAGGRNVAAAANVTGYAKLSDEVVVEQNPEWIVQVGRFGTYPKSAAYNATDAVKQGNVVTINGDYASQPAPRVVYPIVKLAKAFHPDAYAAAKATTTTTADATRTTTAADTTGTGATRTTTVEAMQDASTTATTAADGASDAGGVPGFGVPATLAALAGAAMLARRR